MTTTTSWLSPSSATGTEWTNPNNAKTEDGSEAFDEYVRVAPPGEPIEDTWTSAINLGSYGVSIGAGDEVKGIEVQVKCRRSGAATCSLYVALTRNGVAVGTEKAFGSVGTSLAFKSGGSPTDTWGYLWTPTLVGQIGVNVYAKPTSTGSGVLYVDSVQIRVTYVDGTCNTFTFTDVTNQPVSTLIESNSFTVSGLEAGYAAAVTFSGTAANSAWRKNGGAWLTSGGSVVNGDVVQVRHTTSASYSTAVNTVLNVNSVTDTFQSTTVAADTTPTAFSFTDVTNAERSQIYASQILTVAGINAPTSIKITSGAGSFRKSTDGGATWSVWHTSAATTETVNNGDKFQVRNTSSGSFTTAVNTTLNIGGVTDVFTITTRAADTVPNAYTWTDVANSPVSTVQTSNIITILGVEVTVTIGFVITGTGSAHEYRINGGTWTAASGTPSINNGDTLQLRLTSPAGGGQSATIQTSIDASVGFADSFTVTTAEPDAFTFGTVQRARPNQLYTSAAVAITGLTAGRAISIANGEYKINSGAWTSGAGTINIGDSVTVRAVSKPPGQTVTVTLTINGVNGTYVLNSSPSILEPDF